GLKAAVHLPLPCRKSAWFVEIEEDVTHHVAELPLVGVVDEIVIHPHRQIVRVPREYCPEADELTVNLRSTIVLDFETSQLREQRRNVSGEFIAAALCDLRQRRCIERSWMPC